MLVRSRGMRGYLKVWEAKNADWICNTMIYRAFSFEPNHCSVGSVGKSSTKKSFFIISLSSTIPINNSRLCELLKVFSMPRRGQTEKNMRGKLNNRWLCEKVCFLLRRTNWHSSTAVIVASSWCHSTEGENMFWGLSARKLRRPRMKAFCREQKKVFRSSALKIYIVTLHWKLLAWQAKLLHQASSQQLKYEICSWSALFSH